MRISDWSSDVCSSDLGRAIARIDALDFARDQPVADIVQPRAAIFGIDRRAEQPERAHLRHDLTIEAFVAKRRGHARQQRITRLGSRRVADQPLLFADRKTTTLNSSP